MCKTRWLKGGEGVEEEERGGAGRNSMLKYINCQFISEWIIFSKILLNIYILHRYKQEYKYIDLIYIKK